MPRIIAVFTLTCVLALTLPVRAQTSEAATGGRRHTARGHAAAAEEVEPESGRLKLQEDGWAYSRATKWSKNVERVHAGKFVVVTGVTKNYLQVRLKSGATAYVPQSAVELVTPTDKYFHLTHDTAVYSAPTRLSGKLSEVHQGHDVRATGVSLDYLRIKMKSGLEGFIPVGAAE